MRIHPIFSLINFIDRTDIWLLQIIPAKTKRNIVRRFTKFLIPAIDKVIEVNGFRLYVPHNQHYDYAFKGHEPLTREIMNQYIRKGMTVVDVGANIGYFSILCADFVGDAGKVFAVEPSRDNRNYLQKNLHLNHVTNVQILPYAAGAIRQNRNLYIHKVGSLNSLYKRTDSMMSVSIEEIPLDEVIRSSVDFVKIDVEGGELEVLHGMKQLLDANPSARLFVEWNPSMLQKAGYEPKALPEFLLNAGFTVSVIDEHRGRMQRLEETLQMLLANRLRPSWYANLYAYRG